MTTSPATATNEDFVPKTVNVTFEPGETGPKAIEFEIVDDKFVEKLESFQVSMVSSSVAAVSYGEPTTVNIRDNDGNYLLPENKWQHWLHLLQEKSMTYNANLNLHIS